MHGFLHLNQTSSFASLWASELHISQMALETHFGCMENSFGILRREIWIDTVVHYTYHFHPVMGAVL